MINIYPADYERLKHNWVLVKSDDITAKFLRLDSLPSLKASSKWNGDQSSKLNDIQAALAAGKDFINEFIEGNQNFGFVKATPPAWGGGEELSFTISTLVTEFSDLKRYPKIMMNGKSDGVKLSGSLQDVHKLLELVSPSIETSSDNGLGNAVRYFVHPSYDQYAKYVPVQIKTSLKEAANKKRAEDLGFTDLKLENIIKVISGVSVGNGSNVNIIAAGNDTRLISLTFAMNEQEVYHFGHHFVPTDIEINPAPIMVAYFDDSHTKRYTIPYFKVSMSFKALCVLPRDKMVQIIKVGN